MSIIMVFIKSNQYFSYFCLGLGRRVISREPSSQVYQIDPTVLINTVIILFVLFFFIYMGAMSSVYMGIRAVTQVLGAGGSREIDGPA